MTKLIKKLIQGLRGVSNSAAIKSREQKVAAGTERTFKEYRKTFERLVEYDRSH